LRGVRRVRRAVLSGPVRPQKKRPDLKGSHPSPIYRVVSYRPGCPLKISASLVSELKQVSPASKRIARSSPRTVADESALATVGSYIAELRHAVRTEGPYGGVRPHLVEQIRREFVTGSFGGEADMDRALNALMKEL